MSSDITVPPLRPSDEGSDCALAILAQLAKLRTPQTARGLAADTGHTMDHVQVALAGLVKRQRVVRQVDNGLHLYALPVPKGHFTHRVVRC